jgi:hypothetical protein
VRVVRPQVGSLRGVHDAVGTVLLDRLVDRRLEPAAVDDEVGLGQGGGLRDPELEVVRLLPGAGQGGHVDVLTADPLREELQRVHARHHVDALAALAALAVGGAGGEGEQEQGGRKGPSKSHDDNDSHCK